MRTLMLLLASHFLLACAAAPRLQATMPPLSLAESAAAPAPLERDLFRRDGSGSISEEDLRRVLAAPVVLEQGARLGVVPVVQGYEPDEDLPLVSVPGALSAALADSGLFDVTTEVSTDWSQPTVASPGLRELAARYRVEYLLLYRQRFVDRIHTNAWALTWFTVVGGLAAPTRTLQSAGVVEATLFDVKTGTLLFTVYERVEESVQENIWQNARKRRALKRRLLETTATGLAEKALAKTRRLARGWGHAAAVDTASVLTEGAASR